MAFWSSPYSYAYFYSCAYFSSSTISPSAASCLITSRQQYQPSAVSAPSDNRCRNLIVNVSSVSHHKHRTSEMTVPLWNTIVVRCFLSPWQDRPASLQDLFKDAKFRFVNGWPYATASQHHPHTWSTPSSQLSGIVLSTDHVISTGFDTYSRTSPRLAANLPTCRPIPAWLSTALVKLSSPTPA